METGGEEEQDGLSAHSPGPAPPSSASSLPKEHLQVDLELSILEALEIYPPAKLQGRNLRSCHPCDQEKQLSVSCCPGDQVELAGDAVQEERKRYGKLLSSGSRRTERRRTCGCNYCRKKKELLFL